MTAHTASIDTVACDEFVKPRPGEERVGQRVARLHRDTPVNEQLLRWRDAGIEDVVIGIPEDLGPRANHGRGGADGAWQAFLKLFLNLHWHEDTAFESLAILGALHVDDLMVQGRDLDPGVPRDLARLRTLVAMLDIRLQALFEQVFRAGLRPIVIGGGHNNSLPLIRAATQLRGGPVSVLNCDPHADTRAMEGRHSGNAFRYAMAEELIRRYAVLGLNPLKNSADTLSVFSQPTHRYFEVSPAAGNSFKEAVDAALSWLGPAGSPAGIEVDLDVIAGMPSSALTVWGPGLEQVSHYVSRASEHCSPLWLHLAEGAPACSPVGPEHGQQLVGESLCALLDAFLRAVR